MHKGTSSISATSRTDTPVRRAHRRLYVVGKLGAIATGGGAGSVAVGCGGSVAGELIGVAQLQCGLVEASCVGGDGCLIGQ